MIQIGSLGKTKVILVEYFEWHCCKLMEKFTYLKIIKDFFPTTNWFLVFYPKSNCHTKYQFNMRRKRHFFPHTNIRQQHTKNCEYSSNAFASKHDRDKKFNFFRRMRNEKKKVNWHLPSIDRKIRTQEYGRKKEKIACHKCVII